jgi:hypothetical protein
VTTAIGRREIVFKSGAHLTVLFFVFGQRAQMFKTCHASLFSAGIGAAYTGVRSYVFGQSPPLFKAFGARMYRAGIGAFTAVRS